MASMSPCTVLKGRFPTYAVKGGSVGSSFCLREPRPPPRDLFKKKKSSVSGTPNTASNIVYSTAQALFDFLEVDFPITLVSFSIPLPVPVTSTTGQLLSSITRCNTSVGKQMNNIF